MASVQNKANWRRPESVETPLWKGGYEQTSRSWWRPKQSQFAPARLAELSLRPIMQNEPNLAIADWKMSGGDAQPTKSRNVRNEPNWARPEAGAAGNCAKRSQTWGKWGMWAKAVLAQAVARPGSETCKTNPILPERLGMGAGSPGRAAPPESDCAKQTQFARPRPA
jgi:hypothetical protein